MRHFLSLADLAPDDLLAILDTAHAMKAARAGLSKGAPDPEPTLAGRTLAMIFEKASTRTRFSFEQAMRQAGGSAIVVNAGDMQLGRGEPVRDTARVLSRYVDAVMLRVNTHDTLIEFAEWSDVPVINGLSDHNHPCQIVADLMTLEERGVTLAGAKLAWIGDGNNVCTSFIHASALAGFHLHIAAPEAYAPNADAIATAKAQGAEITVTHASNSGPREAAEGASAVITDCWVSMGDTDTAERLTALAPYQVTPDLMSATHPTHKGTPAPFLHCLPAYRGKEVTEAVFEGESSAVWDEAENRLHAQKAVLGWCMD